jgi:hypothetical protein
MEKTIEVSNELDGQEITVLINRHDVYPLEIDVDIDLDDEEIQQIIEDNFTDSVVEKMFDNDDSVAAKMVNMGIQHLMQRVTYLKNTIESLRAESKQYADEKNKRIEKLEAENKKLRPTSTGDVKEIISDFAEDIFQGAGPPTTAEQKADTLKKIIEFLDDIGFHARMSEQGWREDELLQDEK